MQSPLLAVSPVAIVLKWLAATAAIAGACHAVSGASTYISGLTRYNTPTPAGIVAGSLTNNAYGTNGGKFIFRITVVGAGSDTQFDYYRCTPLPPGLIINTNIGLANGATGFITNSPPNYVMTPGVYPVTLVAGNTSCSGCEVSLNATITILGNGNSPVITGPPVSKAVFAGSNATLTVTHNGAGPFGYQWRKDGSSVNGQTASNLVINTASTNDSGAYSVVVTNSSGSATSSPPAQLTVVDIPKLSVSRTNENLQVNFFQYPGATYTLQYGLQLPVTNWLTLTNHSGAATNTLRSVLDAITNSNRRFYRMQTTIP